MDLFIKKKKMNADIKCHLKKIQMNEMSCKNNFDFMLCASNFNQVFCSYEKVMYVSQSVFLWLPYCACVVQSVGCCHVPVLGRGYFFFNCFCFDKKDKDLLSAKIEQHENYPSAS